MKGKWLFKSGAILFCTMLSFFTCANTLDEIATLDNNKSVTGTLPDRNNVQAKVAQENKPVWLKLANGKTIDIQRWQIVHFLSSQCPYCHQFNPVLKKVSGTIGINVFVYSFDGAGDAVFPSVLPTTTDILNNFFAELPKVTPTDFIVNKDTLVTIPLSQGAISEEALVQRLNESFTLADHMGVL
ncbi:conjugal transfer protein TrbB [Klebsiella pneumoniae]|uniref:type-F conjugative transfer system pilin assembly thiol-disulfide isomerase TrbB n=1 Tax=Klebsiella pneumoniae TaxID=573 RepID=UPI000E2AA316|nr:type-F conjugative transfer system pilin assembly thiol-disulfide isomerase TrbB [Klebsiella pneumoniae]SXT34609.1 conjugal transfer protein TrbB [Klebsiella pneumoniae]HCD1372017.1 type-F conjugative transfer system pilin assembly thiol-disulfide isomerase TrbB [Klebsiella pneumoniae subsp. pneumoniae]